MERPPKPHVPEKVYESAILLYTIVDYHWIPPESKLAQVLEPGWHPIKQYNYDHPRMKQQLKELHEEQERCLKNKEVNWERLSRMYITI